MLEKCELQCGLNWSLSQIKKRCELEYLPGQSNDAAAGAKSDPIIFQQLQIQTYFRTIKRKLKINRYVSWAYQAEIPENSTSRFLIYVVVGWQ